jgi:hypothetical protein
MRNLKPNNHGQINEIKNKITRIGYFTSFFEKKKKHIVVLMQQE